MEKNIFDYISNNGQNVLFGLPSTEELVGRTALLSDGTNICFGSELAVKCDDDLFLADVAGKLLLVEELPDESLKALDTEKAAAVASALPEVLEGWETELSFASGSIFTAVFRDASLTLSPSPEPVIPNPFASGEEEAPKAPELPSTPPLTMALQAVQTGEKRFLLHFPESGETVFFDARRFLLYGILRGRIVAGFADLPPREA